tara:strand:- start:5468 stop:6085 length:618 start_codon:yes stop_codon:yes gene_type:complete
MISADRVAHASGDLPFFGTRTKDGGPQLLNYYWFQEAFSSDECKNIISLAQEYEKQGGTTFAGDGNEYRKSTIRWIPPNESTSWIYERIRDLSIEANETYKLDICGFTEHLQFTEYEGKGAKYGYHVDIGPWNYHRKLSVVLQLSNPKDYTGGDLVINPGGELLYPDKTQGTVIFFPSILQHEVTPLESGNRYSIVSWISGPPWK